MEERGQIRVVLVERVLAEAAIERGQAVQHDLAAGREIERVIADAEVPAGWNVPTGQRRRTLRN